MATNDSNTSGLKPSDLTASVKQLKIIEAIESKYNFNFSRDFFGSYDFTNQFVALSGTEDKTAFQIPLTNPDEGSRSNSRGEYNDVRRQRNVFRKTNKRT